MVNQNLKHEILAKLFSKNAILIKNKQKQCNINHNNSLLSEAKLKDFFIKIQMFPLWTFSRTAFIFHPSFAGQKALHSFEKLCGSIQISGYSKAPAALQSLHVEDECPSPQPN